jgi:ribosomal protein L37AE/L43A
VLRRLALALVDLKMKRLDGAICDRCNKPFLVRATSRITVCTECSRGGIPAEQARALLAESRRRDGSQI